MATSSMDTQGTAEEDSDDAEESPTHYLPNGIFSLEALRFPGLFLGEALIEKTSTHRLVHSIAVFARFMFSLVAL